MPAFPRAARCRRRRLASGRAGAGVRAIAWSSAPRGLQRQHLPSPGARLDPAALLLLTVETGPGSAIFRRGLSPRDHERTAGAGEDGQRRRRVARAHRIGVERNPVLSRSVAIEGFRSDRSKTDVQASDDQFVAPARGRTPRRFHAPRRLTMQEPGNRVFGFRPLFGRDGRSIGIAIVSGSVGQINNVHAARGTPWRNQCKQNNRSVSMP